MHPNEKTYAVVNIIRLQVIAINKKKSKFLNRKIFFKYNLIMKKTTNEA